MNVHDKTLTDPSKRALLKALAAAGAAAVLPGRALVGQSLRPNAPPAAGVIDVHHHYSPPFYAKEMEKELAATAFTPRPWTPEVSLDAMDRHGVATSMLSPVQRLVLDSMSDRTGRARSLTRRHNEFGAQVVRDHGGRFGLLASLPLPDVDGSLAEIEHAFGVLKADGIALWTSYLDQWPGDPAFDPVWAELNRRRAVVFFHPATGTCCRNLIPGLQISGIIEYDLDSARAAESMLVNRTVEKFPGVRFIFSHSGGALTVLAARIADDLQRYVPGRTPAIVEREIRSFYYELAHGTGAPSLEALKALVPIEQMLFGSDVPIREYELTVAGLEAYKGFSAADRQAINRGNAERLFPRLKS